MQPCHRTIELVLREGVARNRKVDFSQYLTSPVPMLSLGDKRRRKRKQSKNQEQNQFVGIHKILPFSGQELKLAMVFTITRSSPKLCFQCDCRTSNELRYGAILFGPFPNFEKLSFINTRHITFSDEFYRCYFKSAADFF